MRRIAVLSIILLLFVVLACQGAWAADPQPLLQGLWSPAQLAATPAERRIRPLPQPDLAPPARQQPVQALAPVPQPLRGVIRRVHLPESDHRVALTFDLCERAVHVTGYDGALVDALRAANARATFFAGGKWMRSHQERALQLMADGRFELGNHAWTHGNLGLMRGTELAQQVLWTQAQYELLREALAVRAAQAGLSEQMRRVPASLRLFRLPFGRSSAESLAYLSAQGLPVVQWDVVGEGGFGGTVEARAKAIAQAVRPGSIILLHANAVPRDTAELVRHLLPLLASRGLGTATVSELLAAGQPEAVSEGYFSEPGDNLIYDRMFQGNGALGRAR